MDPTSDIVLIGKVQRMLAPVTPLDRRTEPG